MSRSDFVKQKILEAFGDIPRPDLRAVRQLGCCKEHDGDFAWYREHTWQELEKEIKAEHFDVFQFGSLHPSAYHYFVPGLLLGTLESIVADAGSQHLRLADWVRNLTPAKDRAANFREKYLPLFTARQRDAVASHLEFFNEREVERQGYSDNDKEIERALCQVWRAET
ncbi:MAG TPA: hypothetical protein VER76_00820 [Pyrinomonadaceae bacterium]|nr:hypothetical protein [Pyrinomonadaceae bacterium]